MGSILIGPKKLLQITNEKAVADRGYRDSQRVTPDSHDGVDILNRIRARGETANGRLKNFFVLRNCFRHSHEKHNICFFAVLSMIQLMADEMPLFQM